MSRKTIYELFFEELDKIASQLNKYDKDLLKKLDYDRNAAYKIFFDLIHYLKTPVIKTSQVDIPKKRRKKLKNLQERKPFVSFTKISIKKEFQRKFQYETNEEEEGIVRSKMKWHEMPAQFRHYSEEKPLFGKYAGTFYVPQHSRGDAKLGVSFKSYTVKGKKENESQ
jgi:hypothetical protein